jgi:hypothetical protein
MLNACCVIRSHITKVPKISLGGRSDLRIRGIAGGSEREAVCVYSVVVVAIEAHVWRSIDAHTA